MEIRRVACGVGKDTRQQSYGRKRKDEREKEEKRERDREKQLEKARRSNGAGVGVERKESMYNPRNTGCSTRHIPTKDENGGPTGGP